MLADERLVEIESQFGTLVQRIVAIELDGETLRLIMYLKDDTNLRVTEQWEGETLKRYSYYWLTSANELNIGWDNAPHHTHLETFPHHKHVERQGNLQPSTETRLEEVMKVILERGKPMDEREMTAEELWRWGHDPRKRNYPEAEEAGG